VSERKVQDFFISPLFQREEIYRVFVQTLNRLENPRAVAY